MLKRWKLSLLLLLPLGFVCGQQTFDPDFDTSVSEPRYESNTGPKIGIDEGHNNFHTIDGRFAPFATVLKSDGYQLSGISDLMGDRLDDLDILVIVNSLHASNLGKWKNPCPSAFSKEEIKRIVAWVEKGGSLLLIADHMPFGGAADDLAKAFGFHFANGFSMSQARIWPPDQFSREKATLLSHPVTDGSEHQEQIDFLMAFTGSALEAPEEASIVAKFSEAHHLLLPEEAWVFDKTTKAKSLEDYCLAASMNWGKGRLFMASEAAMFTAQLAGKEKRKMGMNAPEASQNKTFVLNVIHWLDH